MCTTRRSWAFRYSVTASDWLASALSAPYSNQVSFPIAGVYGIYAIVTNNLGSTASSVLANITVAGSGSAFGGLQLNGIDQYVDFGPATNLGSAVFTLETWFKWTGGGDTRDGQHRKRNRLIQARKFLRKPGPSRRRRPLPRFFRRASQVRPH